ncbi:MAG: ubiquinone/menaquinone biosynthesis methyltransferase [Deltaproteobacteria bacterium]|nr:ubiquinone/menaquinone biosynthesis methyltransferase [Deltaproteobacteria bacterium]
MVDHKQNKSRHKPLFRIFNDINERYDLINRLFTWGMDKNWRDRLVTEMLKSRPQKVLDVGCGTGDLTIRIAQSAQENITVSGYDFSRPMLDIAERKARKCIARERISFIHGDAAGMPFRDATFDCIGISFALRNLLFENPSAHQYLCEIFRVLKPGGKFLSVDSSQPQNKIIRWLDHLYLCTYVYTIGMVISGDRCAYKYLTRSAMNFDSPEQLEKRFLAAGFHKFFYQPLFFGAAAIYGATK